MATKKATSLPDSAIHLPDEYKIGASFIPSEFRLDDSIRDTHNTNKASGITKYVDELKESVAPESESDLVELDNDFKRARATIHEAMEKSSEAITDALVLAQAADSPRGYEVVATMLKAMSEISKDLMHVHNQREVTKAKRQERIQGDHNQSSITNQQNNYYLSSPRDMIRELKSEE